MEPTFLFGSCDFQQRSAFELAKTFVEGMERQPSRPAIRQDHAIGVICVGGSVQLQGVMAQFIVFQQERLIRFEMLQRMGDLLFG